MIGYTAGCFDLLHIGHIRLLKAAKSLCDYLIVGITTNDLMTESKKKRPIFPYEHRREIVSSLEFVDAVTAQHSLDKYEAWKRLRFDVLFVGDDHFQEERWQEYEKKLLDHGVKTIYLPYTRDVNSTEIRKLL